MANETDNLFIGSLSQTSRELLLSKCTPVPLPLRMVLSPAEEMAPYAYFLSSGVASVVASTADGSTAEVSLIGREGVVSALPLLGPALMPTECFMQVEGNGLRIPMPELRTIFRGSEEVHARVLEFVQQQSYTLAQIAGCHRFHDAEERLARWFLMAQDRTQTEVLNLTQEFTAMMLGSRRTTVTLIAGAMQRSGLIEYQRGRLKILDREKLENAACDCYAVTKKLHDGLYKRAYTEF